MPFLVHKQILERGEYVSRYFYAYPDFPGVMFVRMATRKDGD
jgi:hypothetical protein